MAEELNKDDLRVWDFLDDFKAELRAQLEADELRWGDTWLHRVRGGQENRIWAIYDNYYDQWKNGDTPIPWLKVAGLALIGWIRENNRDIFPE